MGRYDGYDGYDGGAGYELDDFDDDGDMDHEPAEGQSAADQGDDDEHEPMSITSHAHGIFGPHAHVDDSDHSDVPVDYGDDTLDAGDGADGEQLAERWSNLADGLAQVRTEHATMMRLAERHAAWALYEGLPDDDEARVQALAERMARRRGLRLSDLEHAERLTIYRAAAKRVGYLG